MEAERSHEPINIPTGTARRLLLEPYEALHATVTDHLPDHASPSGTQSWPPVLSAPGGTWSTQVVVTPDWGYAGPLTNTVQVTTEETAPAVYIATSEVRVTQMHWTFVASFARSSRRAEGGQGGIPPAAASSASAD